MKAAELVVLLGLLRPAVAQDLSVHLADRDLDLLAGLGEEPLRVLDLRERLRQVLAGVVQSHPAVTVHRRQPPLPTHHRPHGEGAHRTARAAHQGGGSDRQPPRYSPTPGTLRTRRPVTIPVLDSASWARRTACWQ